jgi:hypothetical protein
VGGGGRRWLRRAVTATVALLIVGMLAAAGYGFVLKSLPYHTPQLPAPRIRLTAQDTAALAAYPRGVPAVPVLTWRDVSHRPGNLVTTPARFASELAMLRAEGFRSVRLSTLTALAHGRHVKLPARPVALTFDAGLSTDWTTVDPILQRYGFTAVVFVDPAAVALKSPSYFLTHDELGAMAASGRWAVGLQLPRQPTRSRAAAAKAQLQAIVGTQVTAYAWPVAAIPSTIALQAPLRIFPSLRGEFGIVFDRAATGPAIFVAAGSARRSLPRLDITAATTPQALAASLRTGIPSPPPPDPLTLPWRSDGGTCARTRLGLRLQARGFALCEVIADGSRWRDYGLSVRLRFAPSADLTALIDLRLSTAGRIEIAIGRSGVSVKQYVHQRWSVLQTVTAPRPVAPDGVTLSFLRSGVMPVRLRLAGTLLSAKVGTLVVQARMSRAAGSGVIAVGLVARGRKQAVSYDGLRLTPG